MAKDPTLLRSVPKPVTGDDIEAAMAKLSFGRNQVDEARNLAESRGVTFAEQNRESLREADADVKTLDQQIGDERSYLERADRAIADLNALRAEHADNLRQMEVRRLSKIDQAASLRRQGVTY